MKRIEATSLMTRPSECWNVINDYILIMRGFIGVAQDKTLGTYTNRDWMIRKVRIKRL